jgi:pimeloyl-ACP methyl ester carboxylesterase
MTTTKYLERQSGIIAYDDSGGDGQLVIAAPGMGDTRRVYRHLGPALTEAGLRLVTMDLRGMGESSVSWDDLTDEGVASDYLALIDELDAGPAVLIGNSLSCASAVIAATDAPDKVAGIILIGPFVREVPTKWWQKAMFAAMLAPPWGRSAWISYYRKSLYPGPKPPDHDEYVAALSRNLSESGRFASFRGLAANKHTESGRRLPRVTQPALVIMGTADPDFPDATAEANEVGAIMGAEVLLVESSGHYPQADSPDQVAPKVIDFISAAP